MTTLREAAQQALEALEMHVPHYLRDRGYPPITALKAALAEPTLTQQMTDAGFTPRDNRLTCDECGGKFTRQMLPIHKCAALAKPMQEPVAWMNTEDGFCTLDSPVEGIDVMSQWAPLYAAPPQPEERNFCPRCGKRNSGVHTCTPPSTEPQCNPHPKAPHGFLRNASHTEDRYVCECEYWDPYEAGYQAGCEAMLKQEDREPAALLTTWVSETEAVTEPLFKAPRRLTDTEIGEVWFAARIPGLTETDARRLIRAAEARSGAR